VGLPIHVEAYAGYRANERPRRFELDGVEYRIYAWDREWRTPDHHFFLVRAGGKRYVLRHDEQSDAWTLLDKFDGTALFARPNLTIVPVDETVIRNAQRRVLAVQPKNRAIPGNITEYLLCGMEKTGDALKE
jgi:hypothetical protein